VQIISPLGWNPTDSKELAEVSHVSFGRMAAARSIFAVRADKLFGPLWA